jgi:hypothetical protein
VNYDRVDKYTHFSVPTACNALPNSYPRQRHIITKLHGKESRGSAHTRHAEYLPSANLQSVFWRLDMTLTLLYWSRQYITNPSTEINGWYAKKFYWSVWKITSSLSSWERNFATKQRTKAPLKCIRCQRKLPVNDIRFCGIICCLH